MRIRQARTWRAEQEDDPYFGLYIAIIERARRDVACKATPYGSGRSPSVREQEEAQQFLAELVESATRRTD
jgi:hypothetical protein